MSEHDLHSGTGADQHGQSGRTRAGRPLKSTIDPVDLVLCCTESMPAFCEATTPCIRPHAALHMSARDASTFPLLCATGRQATDVEQSYQLGVLRA